MSKRHLDDENLSTYEIKRLRDEQLNQIRLNGLNKEGNLLNELERMSANGEYRKFQSKKLSKIFQPYGNFLLQPALLRHLCKQGYFN